jgi:hypothetical protein
MDADRRKAEALQAAGIPLVRLNVNPLPNEEAIKKALENCKGSNPEHAPHWGR